MVMFVLGPTWVQEVPSAEMYPRKVLFVRVNRTQYGAAIPDWAALKLDPLVLALH
jgi:hypothetical protein